MRFSIKWMLRVVALFAAAFASTIYASQLWIDALSLAILAALVGTAAGAVLQRNAARAFCLGFALALAATLVAFTSKFETSLSYQNLAGRIVDRVVRLVPTQDRVVQKYLEGQQAAEPFLGESVRLTRQGDGTYQATFDSPYGAGGYGGGYGMAGGYGARAYGAAAPPTFVIPAAVLRGVPRASTVEEVVRRHLLLAAALSGGLLALAIHRRENLAERQRAAQAWEG